MENQEELTVQNQGLEDSQEDIVNNADIQDESFNNNNDDKTEVPGEAQENIYGAPERYDYSALELPADMKLDDEMIQEFEPIARKFNLSNDSACELVKMAAQLVDKNMKSVDPQELAKMVQQAKIDGYKIELNNDKELQVDNESVYGPYLATAQKGLDAFATPEFKKLLSQEGLTHSPAVIKTFHAIGKLCESEKIPGIGEQIQQKETPAQILYGNNKK